MSITPINEPAPNPLDKYADTTRYRKLANGAIYDNTTHRIAATPGGGLSAFTSESARKAVVIREQEKIEAIQAGLMDGTDQRTAGKALQAIIGAQSKRASSDHNRSTEAARLVLQVAGVISDKPQAPGNVTVNVLALDRARAILADLDIIEGELLAQHDDSNA